MTGRRIPFAILIASVNLWTAEPPRILIKFPAPPGPPVHYFPNMPKVDRLPDGTLAAFFVPVESGRQFTAARYSRDNGRTWSEPRKLFDLPSDAGGFGYFERMVDRDGEIHLFYLNDANTGVILPPRDGRPVIASLARQRLDIWHVRSRDQHSRWDAPKKIWEGRAGDLKSVIQLRNGRIVLPISWFADRAWSHRGTGPNAFTYAGEFSCGALYSDDAGITWRQSPDELVTPAPDLSTLGAVEPVALELKDGRVWMLLRTQMGRFYESFSHDGERWSKPTPSHIISSDSPAGLTRLPDGRILLVWNNCLRFPYAYGGRQVLHAALSSDEGKTWRGYREIARDPHRNDPPPPTGDHGVSYPFQALAADGKLILSLFVATGPERAIYAINPAWLGETRQTEDFNRGLEDWSTFGTRGVELKDRALVIRKPDPGWAAGAVWNFPNSTAGKLRLELRLNAGFQGGNIGLTDHFSTPFDPEDSLFNVFNFDLRNSASPTGEWRSLIFEWNTAEGTCRVSLNGEAVATLRARRQSDGLNYLRLKSTALKDDAGFSVRAAEMAGSD